MRQCPDRSGAFLDEATRAAILIVALHWRASTHHQPPRKLFSGHAWTGAARGRISACRTAGCPSDASRASSAWMLNNGNAVDRGAQKEYSVSASLAARPICDTGPAFFCETDCDPLHAALEQRCLPIFPAGRHSNFTNSRVGCLTQVNVPSPASRASSHSGNRRAPDLGCVGGALGNVILFGVDKMPCT